MRQNPFINFIRKECPHYVGRDNNRLTSAAGQASRYYDYLSLILKRYAIADKALRNERQRIEALSDAKLNGFPKSELDRSAQLQCKLLLEIESFYVFAKTLLDKAAQLVHLYFGTARRCSLDSHHKFLKDYKIYIKARNLSDSQSLVEMMTKLQYDIVNFRDKKLIHQNNPGIFIGMAFPKKRGAYISAGHYYPVPSDKPYQSHSLDSLIEDIDKYISCLLSWMTSNRGHVVLKKNRQAVQRSEFGYPIFST